MTNVSNVSDIMLRKSKIAVGWWFKLLAMCLALFSCVWDDAVNSQPMFFMGVENQQALCWGQIQFCAKSFLT